MNHTLNNYRYKKFGDKYFITTDHGVYAFLDEPEFKRLKENNLDEKLKEELEKKGIIITDRNIGGTAKALRNRHEFLFRGTSLHIIVVTLRCNMKCVYCHASSRSKDESTKP